MDPLFFEKILLKLLFGDKEARGKILPFLTTDIFDEDEHKKIVKEIQKFEEEYNKFPTISDLKLRIDDEKVFAKIKDILETDISEYSRESLLHETQEFFKRQLIWNHITEANTVIRNNENIDRITEIADDMRLANSFSFDTQIGFDLFNEQDRMYEFLHNKDIVVPLGCKIDKFIEGGLHNKTLTILMAETNLGKTLIKCSWATNILLQNHNVLYITLEMAEEKISERILQNMLDLTKKQLKMLGKDDFDFRFNSLKEKIKRTFVVKQYPAGTLNANKLRSLIKELDTKKKFKPRVIFLDYLTLFKGNFTNKNDNSYAEHKRISEEVRAVAIEENLPIVSSLQTNRKGMGSSDIDFKDMADSVGPAATADIFITATQSDALKELERILIVILKNRYGPKKIRLNFGMDVEKMRVFDVEDGAQTTNQQIESKEKKDKAVASIKDSISRDRREKRNKRILFE